MKVTLQINIQSDIIRKVAFFINNICVKFGGHVYQQTVDIPMGTNYYIDLIYLEELEIKDTRSTDAPKWANYLDLRLEFDEDGRFYTFK